MLFPRKYRNLGEIKGNFVTAFRKIQALSIPKTDREHINLEGSMEVFKKALQAFGELSRHLQIMVSRLL
jgi:hypothetical protein